MYAPVVSTSRPSWARRAGNCLRNTSAASSNPSDCHCRTLVYVSPRMSSDRGDSGLVASRSRGSTTRALTCTPGRYAFTARRAVIRSVSGAWGVA